MGSEREAQIIAACEKFNRPLPTEIANKPVLKPGLWLYLSAYITLDTERSHREGATPIPYTSLLQYIDFHGIHDDSVGDFLHFLRAMDAANCKRIDEKIKQEHEKVKTKSKHKR